MGVARRGARRGHGCAGLLAVAAAAANVWALRQGFPGGSVPGAAAAGLADAASAMGRQLTVQQLKARLSEQGLATSGRKADLVQRLLEAAPLPEPAAPCAKAKPKPRTEPATRPPAKAKPAAKRRAKPSPRPAAAGALQDERRFFAACAGGLEAALEGELRDLGAADVQRKSRGVYFSGDSRLGCRVLIGARCANAMDEVLRASPQPLRDREELYSFVQEARPWPQVFPNHETLRVDTVLASRDVAEDIRHTHYSALTVCKAVCDACREATGARPSVSLHAPDWAFNLYYVCICYYFIV